jgi:hypothetical protein
MRRIWILAMAALVVAIILLPRLAEADSGPNSWSLRSCGEVWEGPAFPVKMVEMKTSVNVPMPRFLSALIVSIPHRNSCPSLPCLVSPASPPSIPR